MEEINDLIGSFNLDTQEEIKKTFKLFKHFITSVVSTSENIERWNYQK